MCSSRPHRLLRPTMTSVERGGWAQRRTLVRAAEGTAALGVQPCRRSHRRPHTRHRPRRRYPTTASQLRPLRMLNPWPLGSAARLLTACVRPHWGTQTLAPPRRRSTGRPRWPARIRRPRRGSWAARRPRVAACHLAAPPLAGLQHTKRRGMCDVLSVTGDVTVV